MKNFNEILKQEIRSTKQSYFATLISQANAKTKWKIITSILNKNTKSSITTSIDEKDFLNYFSKTFSAKQNTISKEVTKDLYVKQHFLENVPQMKYYIILLYSNQNILSKKMTCPMAVAMCVWHDIEENVGKPTFRISLSTAQLLLCTTFPKF